MSRSRDVIKIEVGPIIFTLLAGDVAGSVGLCFITGSADKLFFLVTYRCTVAGTLLLGLHV